MAVPMDPVCLWTSDDEEEEEEEQETEAMKNIKSFRRRQQDVDTEGVEEVAVDYEMLYHTMLRQMETMELDIQNLMAENQYLTDLFNQMRKLTNHAYVYEINQRR